MPGKILVIDDEPLILTAVERALAKVGYAITTARDMNELDQALGLAPFDLLITDVHILDATLDEIIHKVRNSSPMVRVIKMSGSSNRENSPYFIEKPFSINALRNKVKEILDEPS